jgi:hypothetical protein
VIFSKVSQWINGMSNIEVLPSDVSERIVISVSLVPLACSLRLSLDRTMFSCINSMLSCHFKSHSVSNWYEHTMIPLIFFKGVRLLENPTRWYVKRTERNVTKFS